MHRRDSVRVGRTIQQRHEGIPKAIVDRAWDAQLRLCGRFRRLLARGKNMNVSMVAVARELAGSIWDIGRMAMALALALAISLAISREARPGIKLHIRRNLLKAAQPGTRATRDRASRQP
jgi:hypothetical protein